MGLQEPFDRDEWGSLISESQFAREMITSGLRYLCEVPFPRADDPDDRSYTNHYRYTAHVGLHYFTSGFERLCKLTLVCAEWLNTGKFAHTFDRTHQPSFLIKQVEALVFADKSVSIPGRPQPTVSDEFLKELDLFTKSDGRYEYLNALESKGTAPRIYSTWVREAKQTEVSDLAQRVDFVRETMEGILLENEELYSLIEPLVQATLAKRMDKESISLAIRLAELVRWVASILFEITTVGYSRGSHTSTLAMPLLYEVIPELGDEPESLVINTVIGFQDFDAVEEAVWELYRDPFEHEEAEA